MYSQINTCCFGYIDQLKIIINKNFYILMLIIAYTFLNTIKRLTLKNIIKGPDQI